MSRAAQALPMLEPRTHPRILVVGDVAEMSSGIGVPVVRASLNALGDIPEPVSAVVVDRRAYDAFRIVTWSTALEDVPVMVVADGDVPDEDLELIQANDIAVRPVRPLEFAKRVRMLADLGSAKAETDFMERLLEYRETLEHAILDGVDVGIVTTDENEKVTFINREAASLLGLGEMPVANGVRTLLGLGESPEQLLGGEARKTLAYAMPRPDGSELDLEVTVTRAEGAAHDRLGFFFIFRDLTEDKLRESERRRFERLAAMGTMVAGFAHEVRNPVASLRSLAESMSEELAERSLALPHLPRMYGVLDRIERLVRTSLQFGRPATPHPAAHRPWTLLSQALEAVAPRARQLGGDLHVEVEPELPDVHVDEGQFVQVLVILLNNALDATGAPHRVHLRAIRSRLSEVDARGRKSQPPVGPPRVRFEVTDDGPGIAPDVANRIFDPFFTTKPMGTGLGLSIAQQLVGENGGRLEFSSTRGGPTMFVVVTPSA